MKTENYPIDIVLLWVDGEDPVWQKRREACRPVEKDTAEERYRDWGMLPYWFRSLERHAPWVNRIHFISDGQVPEWLNKEHPRLHVVHHADFIPKQRLPLFNSEAIEMHLHLIPGLAEHFIYFNDDMFLTAPARRTDFFRNRLPVDSAVLSILDEDQSSFSRLAAMRIINRAFSKRTVLRTHFRKWYYPGYGSYLLRTLLLSPWSRFPGMMEPHRPQPYLRSVFEEVWSRETEALQHTASCRFRTIGCVNQWLFRYWQLVNGSFYPGSVLDRNCCIDLTEDNFPQIESVLLHKTHCELCLNDSASIKNPEEFQARLQNVLEQAFPESSSFEHR